MAFQIIRKSHFRFFSCRFNTFVIYYHSVSVKISLIHFSFILVTLKKVTIRQILKPL